MTEIIPLSLGFTNAYLLKNADYSMLVDAGNAGRADRLTRQLALQGVDPADLRLLLLTHGHPDHTGAAAEYARQYGVPVAMHPLEYRDPPRAKNLRSRTALGWIIARATHALGDRPYNFSCSAFFEGGESLAQYGFPDARVIALPGHTKGSIGVLLDDGRLLGGDMFMCFTGVNYALIFEDREALQATADGLGGMGVTEVYPGHGRPFMFSALPEKV